jgi:hypothetical protein
MGKTNKKLNKPLVVLQVTILGLANPKKSIFGKKI